MLHVVLPQAQDWIDAALSSGGAVLVHCHEGKSRSVTLLLAYLMLNRGLTLAAALLHMRWAWQALWLVLGATALFVGSHIGTAAVWGSKLTKCNIAMVSALRSMERFQCIPVVHFTMPAIPW